MILLVDRKDEETDSLVPRQQFSFGFILTALF